MTGPKTAVDQMEPSPLQDLHDRQQLKRRPTEPEKQVFFVTATTVKNTVGYISDGYLKLATIHFTAGSCNV